MKLRVDTFLVKLQFSMLAGIVVTQVLGKNAVSRGLFTLTFPVTVSLWLLVSSRRISRRNLLAIMIVLASFASVLMNALLTNTGISFSYFKKLFMFCSTVLFFAAMCEYRPGETVVALVLRLNSFLAVFLVVMYYVRNPQMHLFNGQVTRYLTFRFTNPNLAAVFLSAIGILEMLHTVPVQRCLARLWHGALSGYMVWFVFQTQARNAEFLILFFLLFYLLALLFPRAKLRMKRGLARLIVTLPLLFAVVYMLCIYLPGVQEWFAFLIGEGKKLDSRVRIWAAAFRALQVSPFFGAYSQISSGTGQSQMHNSHLDVMASYGIVVFTMLCVFLYRVLRKANSGGNRRMQFLCKMGFAALLLSGIGEAMLFSGGLGIYIFSGILLMLANYDFESGRRKNENRISQ